MIVHFIYANVPIVCGGRAGWKRTVFFSHTYRSQYFVWWKGGVEIDGLGRCNCMLQDQRHIARTRTEANSISWWKGGVEKNGVLFAHVPEPIVLHGGRMGGKEQWFFAHVPELFCLYGGRTGWKRTVL